MIWRTSARGYLGRGNDRLTRGSPLQQVAGPARSYFNAVLIAVNLVLSLVPTPFTAVMIASAMPAAINPYSMAVAPDSSRKKLRNVFIAAVWGPKAKVL
jgi:hypothetical protein